MAYVSAAANKHTPEMKKKGIENIQNRIVSRKIQHYRNFQRDVKDHILNDVSLQYWYIGLKQ